MVGNWFNAGLLSAIACLGTGCGGESKQPIYTAIVDAGSSGTRMYLYKVVPGSYPVVEHLLEQEYDAAENGIDEFINGQGGVTGDMGPDQVGPYVIGPLLNAIKPKLQALSVAPRDVLVEVLATAGMRTEEIRNGGSHTDENIAQFYDGIKTYITHQGFPVGDVRTTDGNSEEGKWSWINLNDKYRHAFTTQESPVGVVEVGGSSVQVTYPTHTTPAPGNHVYPVTIGGKIFFVFSKTYPGLGQDEARKAMRTAGYPDAYTGGTDCFPMGMTTAEDKGDLNIRVSPQTVLPVVKLRTAGGDATSAAYRFEACSNTFNSIIANTIESLGDPQIENSSGHFYGINSAFYAYETFGIHEGDISAELLAEKTQDMCADKSNFDLTKGFSRNQCASATYINALTYGPSGLFANAPDAFVKVVPTKSAGATVLSWTRGYLMNKHGQ